jgi:hypothetical protein
MTLGKNSRENEREFLRDKYLWDGSGEPDPEVQRLEAALGNLRHDRPTPIFPAVAPARTWTELWPQWGRVPRLAAVAAAVVVVAAAGFLALRSRSIPTTLETWQVTRIAGTPRVGQNEIDSKEGTRKLGEGQVLETDGQSRASLSALAIGEIDVEPGTRVRLVGSKWWKRLALDRGTIHAKIWAPAGQFMVDTPSALAVDLGCTYTLQVDDWGAGLLRTQAGWVGFRSNGHESFIPAGAACASRPASGPGTPYFEDASPALRAALAMLDFEDRAPEQLSQDLGTVLTESRKSDALTLWHLLSRVNEAQRGRVFNRLAELVPPPPGVTRAGIMRLDRRMLDQWWNVLGFDDIEVWRHWEREWSRQEHSTR